LTFLRIILYNTSKGMYRLISTVVIIGLLPFHHVCMGELENAW